MDARNLPVGVNALMMFPEMFIFSTPRHGSRLDADVGHSCTPINNLDGKSPDKIKKVELFEVLSSDNQVFGRGWYAVTCFLSALPSQVEMRGIRVRQVNRNFPTSHLAQNFTC
jgi:hypothetical protein